MAGALLHDRPSRALRAGGGWIEVRVRESRRARRMRVTVAPCRPPEVVVPAGTPDRSIDRFLGRHRRWIEEQVAAAAAVAARTPLLGLDGRIWLAGEPVEVVRREGAVARAGLRDGRLVVAGAGDAAGAVERWYRREARARISRAVEREAARLGAAGFSIAIRDQRTRWGSCSRAGTLSFSWRLAVAPHEVLAYVAVHEICHLRELNHSQAFWRLVDAARPGWRRDARWLRDHGRELRAYEPASALTRPARA